LVGSRATGVCRLTVTTAYGPIAVEVVIVPESNTVVPATTVLGVHSCTLIANLYDAGRLTISETDLRLDTSVVVKT